MKILITGITGQVGSILSDFIIENTDWDIIGLMRWQESQENIKHLTKRINEGDRVFLENGDLNDLPSLTKIITNYKPDFISHLAAQSFPKTSFDSPIETLNTNIMGTLNLLESIRSIKSKDYDPIIHICSSSEVYGKAVKNQLLNESSNFHAASPYSLSKIGTDYLGQFYAEAYDLRTFVTRMGTHTGRRRSDVFFESTVAKQIALIENNLQEPVLNLGNLESVRTFQDCRDAVRAYYKLLIASSKGKVPIGECFNIAGNEAFKLDEVVKLLLNMSTVKNINVRLDPKRLRPVDADYQMFDNSKLLQYIDWSPTIKAEDMFLDLLNYWRDKISLGDIPLNR